MTSTPLASDLTLSVRKSNFMSPLTDFLCELFDPTALVSHQIYVFHMKLYQITDYHFKKLISNICPAISKQWISTIHLWFVRPGLLFLFFFYISTMIIKEVPVMFLIKVLMNIWLNSVKIWGYDCIWLLDLARFQIIQWIKSLFNWSNDS